VVGVHSFGLKQFNKFSGGDNDVLIAITQEFGTVSPTSVFSALREENWAYNYSNDQTTITNSALKVRNAFYVETD